MLKKLLILGIGLVLIVSGFVVVMTEPIELIENEITVSYPDTTFEEQPRANGHVRIAEPEKISLGGN